MACGLPIGSSRMKARCVSSPTSVQTVNAIRPPLGEILICGMPARWKLELCVKGFWYSAQKFVHLAPIERCLQVQTLDWLTCEQMSKMESYTSTHHAEGSIVKGGVLVHIQQQVRCTVRRPPPPQPRQWLLCALAGPVLEGPKPLGRRLLWQWARTCSHLPVEAFMQLLHAPAKWLQGEMVAMASTRTVDAA